MPTNAPIGTPIAIARLKLEILPPQARDLINEHRQRLKRLFARNIEAEKTKLDPDAASDVLLTFFSGFCIEQNLKVNKAQLMTKATDFLSALRGL